MTRDNSQDVVKTTHYRGASLRQRRNGTVQADLCLQGLRHRRRWPSVREAQDWVDTLLADAGRQATPLSIVEYREAQQAIALLPSDVGLLEAARYYVRMNSQQEQKSLTLHEAIDEWLEAKQVQGVSQKALENYGYQVRSLLDQFADYMVSDISPRDLTQWLSKRRQLGATTRANYRRNWSTFFTWAERQGYTDSNPAAKLDRPVQRKLRPGILTVNQAGALLAAAQTIEPRLVTWIAVGLFAGVRVNELRQLKVTHVDLNENIIHIPPEVAKTGVDRYVSIQPNLRAWLELYLPKRGPICPLREMTRVRRFDAVRKAADIDPWPANAMRHSFGSYHLALFQDSGRTAAEMGQRDPNVLFAHYRRLVKKAAAAGYFNLKPVTDSSQ